MKFLCPSCKAKYQIADEKVIGRTVKMKCRQCGHLIEINEAVIGGLALSSAAPPKVAPSTTPPGVGDKVHDDKPAAPTTDLQSATGSRVPIKGAPPAKPVRSATPAAGMAAVSPRTAELHAPAKPTRAGPTASAARHHAQPPEKPRTSVLPAPRPAPTRPAASATPTPAKCIAQAEPIENAPSSSRRAAYAPLEPATTPQRASSLGHPAAQKASTVGRLPGVPETVASSLSAGVGRAPAGHQDPLAGAFTKAVAATAAIESTAAKEHALAGDEWYVGVNDQPIGPIRLAEIRDRAARGEVTPECLVWRDGFEDWKPLVAFPELVAVVEEGIASYRSLRPPPPSPAGKAAAPLVPQAAVQPQLQPAVSPPAAVHFDDEALAAAGISKPKIPIAAWGAVFGALALGVTIGLVVIKPEPAKQVIKYVEVPASGKVGGAESPPPAPAANEDSNAQTPSGESAANDKRTGGGPRKIVGNGAPDTAAVAASSEISQGLKGLQGLQGLGAPKTGPASGDVGASASGRQQLDSATLSRTVSRYTASVKRSCWQPALDTRAPDASTSARISANIVVAPSGKVQSVTVSPDPKGYRGLSSCIQSRVRNWEFPPAGGSTEFNVPFVFAAQ